MEPSEEELIKGCIAGNASAQNKLYNRFESKLFSICMRYMHNREEAEDLLQEGFMIIFQKLYQFKGEGPLERWMSRIIVNKSIEVLRKTSFLHPTVNFDETKQQFVSADDIMDNIASKDLLYMIQDLPPACRAVFNMYAFEGMKHKEIAKLLGVSESASKSNLNYARKLLKNKIAPNIPVIREA